VLVLAVVRVLEAGVAEHEQLHDDAEGEHVGLLGAVGPLLVDLGAGVHARARDVLGAGLLLRAREALVRQPHDELLVQ